MTDIYAEAIGQAQSEPTETDVYQEAVDPNRELGVFGTAKGAVDVALTGLASTAAAPVGGLTGAATLAATSDIDKAVSTQETVQDALSFDPVSEEGREMARRLQEALAPMAQLVADIQKKTGDMSFELGGGDDSEDAALGAAASALPTAVATAIPVVGPALRKVTPKPDLERSLRNQKPEDVAANVAPDIDVVQAADRLGINLEPGTVSTDKSFVELTQSLKAKPGNSLAVSELEAIEQLGLKGQELIEGVTSRDRTAFSDNVKAEFDQTISDLNIQSQKLLEDVVPDRTIEVAVAESEKYIVQMLDEVGNNFDALSKPERDLLRLVDSKKVTYGAIDRIRRNIGMAFDGRGPYKDTEDSILDQVYGAIARDQMHVADDFGSGDNLRLSNQLVQQRKELEKQTLQLFGRDLQRTLVSKITNARAGLNRGDITEFRKLMDTLPDKFKGDGAAMVVDALMGDNRGKFSLGAFAGAVDTFKRNPSLKSEVLSHFNKEQRQVFNDLSTVATAIQRTKSRENTSGTGKTILAALEGPGAIAKLTDVARSEIPASVAGLPGLGALVRQATGRKDAGQEATNLLTSERFRVALRKVADGKIQEANRVVEGSKEYRAWAKVNPTLAKEVPIVGFFSWVAQTDEN